MANHALGATLGWRLPKGVGRMAGVRAVSVVAISLVVILSFVVIAYTAFARLGGGGARREGFIGPMPLTPGAFPASAGGALLRDFPHIGRNSVSNDSAMGIWWYYPVLPLGSFKQITNNLRYRRNPDNGTCARSDFCGALYHQVKNKSNVVRQLPEVPDGPGARVGYFRATPNLLLQPSRPFEGTDMMRGIPSRNATPEMRTFLHRLKTAGCAPSDSMVIYGSVLRFDYIPTKSDVDVAIFTDNEASTLFCLSQFLRVPKSQIKKVVWKLHGEMLYGYKIKHLDRASGIPFELSIYNTVFEPMLLAEHARPKDWSAPLLVGLYALKFAFYQLGLLSPAAYSSTKRLMMNGDMGSEFMVL